MCSVVIIKCLWRASGLVGDLEGKKARLLNNRKYCSAKGLVMVKGLTKEAATARLRKSQSETVVFRFLVIRTFQLTSSMTRPRTCRRWI